MKKSKIAVIGGSGFIGTQLITDLIAQNHDVVCVDKNETQTYPDIYIKADVREPESLLKALNGCDIIYNLAAEHKDDVRPLSLYYDVNVTGARNVCDAADQLGINTIIFTSSVAIYGLDAQEPDETSPISPFNAYGQSKADAEKVYQTWQNEEPQNRTLSMVRPCVVFGPQNRGNVYNLMKQVAENRFIMIGDGTNKKSMASLYNVSAFLVHMLGFEAGVHIYNYADKPDTDMNTLITTLKKALGKGGKIGLRLPYCAGYAAGFCFDMLAKITNKTFPISRVRIKKFCSDTIVTANKKEKTGFIAPKNLQEALAQTIAYEFLPKNE